MVINLASDGVTKSVSEIEYTVIVGGVHSMGRNGKIHRLLRFKKARGLNQRSDFHS